MATAKLPPDLPPDEVDDPSGPDAMVPETHSNGGVTPAKPNGENRVPTRPDLPAVKRPKPD